METFVQFLVDYGYWLVFVWVALDQIGVPLPSIPVMLAAGALSASGDLSPGIVVVVALLASVPVDLAWYVLGKARGGRVLNLLCVISLEPDYCVRNTERLFTRLGPLSLIVAKFVPGLQTIAPPMAGMTGMSLSVFLLLDTAGALLWAGLLTGTGFFFGEELTALAERFAELGIWAGIVAGTLVTLWLGIKLTQRRLFLRTLRMRRLSPQEVHARLTTESDVHVIDLRHQFDVDVTPHTVPGALRIPMEFIDRNAHRIPRSSDIILYCS